MNLSILNSMVHEETSVSIIIPAYNEGKEIEFTVADVGRIAGKIFKDYEILVFDDCSTDETGKFLDRIAKNKPCIRVFHNKKNMNMGYNFRIGIKHATKKYVMLLSGPDCVSLNSIRDFLKTVGEKPITSSYIANKDLRQRYRRVISALVTQTMNLLFGLRLKYYFGMQAYETKLVKNIRTTTNSFGLLAELLIRLKKQGYPHAEVPYKIRRSKGTSTTAFRIKNVAGIIKLSVNLFFEINLSRLRKS